MGRCKHKHAKHTHVAEGTRVRLVTFDGEEVIGIFEKRQNGVLFVDGRRFPKKTVKSFRSLTKSRQVQYHVDKSRRNA
jgi:translation initiation factor 6 (eIF-6)